MKPSRIEEGRLVWWFRNDSGCFGIYSGEIAESVGNGWVDVKRDDGKLHREAVSDLYERRSDAARELVDDCEDDVIGMATFLPRWPKPHAKAVTRLTQAREWLAESLQLEAPSP